jgi:hypothetical protein
LHKGDDDNDNNNNNNNNNHLLTSRPRWLISYIEFYCWILELNDADVVYTNAGYAGQ